MFDTTMHTSCEIRITQVANGWIVSLPVIHVQQGFEDILRQQAKIIKEEMQPDQDEVLKKIIEENKIPEVQSMTYKDLKEPSIHIFKYFHEVEVLEFLNYTMGIPKPEADAQ